jgi:hypothetical protein
MRVEAAIGHLKNLKEEGTKAEVLSGGQEFTAWKAKSRAVIAQSLGKDDNLIERFDGINYSLSMWSTGTPDYVWDQARHSGIHQAIGLIDAAIYQLKFSVSNEELLDEDSFDLELWEHVKNLVADEDWPKVASQTAIFVENHLRTWACDPKDKSGESLYGKSLYAKVLADDSDWRLGNRAGEHEGWRFLGMGFAQALGNVDRHRIQNRDDARRYAIGVLGLGSLLLSQLRYEHAARIAEYKEQL